MLAGGFFAAGSGILWREIHPEEAFNGRAQQKKENGQSD
jgi:hypothetical protein